MMKNRIFSACGGVLIFLMLMVPALTAQTSSQIQLLIENSLAKNAFWSVQVRNSSGEIIEDLNSGNLVRPASVFKLISSGAFLDKLGPGYTFETSLYGRGYQEGERWRGDLIIVGTGDPSINGEFYNNDPLFLFEKWYRVLESHGIRQIDGNLVAVNGYFDDIPYPQGWEWDDLSYYYAPEISALSFNFNVVDLEVTAEGEVGSVPGIQWFPFNTPYVNFVNEQLITPSTSRYDESYRRVLGTNTIVLRSTLPQGYYETEPLSVANPAMYFIDTFSRYLERGNIPVLGQLLVEQDYRNGREEDLTLLDRHVSEPLYKMVEWLNRESDNFYTEMLLKAMAAESYGVQGSTELGLEILKGYMDKMGFDTLNVNLRDGSGMAPATLIQAGDLNQFLVNIGQEEYFDYYYNSLSTGGINGTLSYRFRNSIVREKFYGKTGFVSGVRSLAGFLDTQSGQRLAVSIFTNNYTARTAHVDLIHESILEHLYESY
ncbi:MAG: D-alanyl-D-alanine carboxypeptidase/D-alanyl-D-alanine-endopeptidase [Balneolaceae bacterium]